MPKKGAPPPKRNTPPRLAAIDVGSNAMRMQVAELLPGFVLKPIKSIRSPVRLGRDVFANQAISEASMKKALTALRSFSEWMEKLEVSQYTAVATSAAREAANGKHFLDTVRKESGIDLQLLAGEEEARVVYLAVQRRLPLGDRTVLVVDIGGGSVELILGQHGRVQALESMKMGTVRMLQRLGGQSQDFARRAREYVESTRSWVDYWLQQQKVEVFVATGGNAEELGDLAQRLFHKPGNDQVTQSELDHITGLLESMSLEDRQKKLGLRPDRADVLLPALLVLQSLMRHLQMEVLVIPHVGLKDGLLEDLRFQALGQRPDGLDREQVLSSVLQLGRKYDFDEAHARKVTELSLQLFDPLQPIHKLNPSHRLLLEAAAWLHDIGKFINFSAHHKHSHYIIMSSPLVGLTTAQRHLVAAIARYHRKAEPGPQHDYFRNFGFEERNLVTRLSAMLRLAEALDAEHGGMVSQILVRLNKQKVHLTLLGETDLLLERWAAATKLAPFEKALGVKMVIA
jgi:exopolyphosphatase/guanosine-5'-triphosphate,3'-diphosphate pyrophosphatase